MSQERWADYVQKLKRMDWFYAYSDDHSIYQKGSAAESELMRLKQILSTLDEEKAQKLWDQYDARKHLKEDDAKLRRTHPTNEDDSGFNPVLTRDNTRKLFTPTEPKKVKVEEAPSSTNDLGSIYQEALSSLAKVKKFVSSLSKKSMIEIRKGILQLELILNSLSEDIGVLDDGRALERINSAIKLRSIIAEKLESGVLKKASDLREQVEKLSARINKIDLNEDRLKYLDKDKGEAFAKLSPTKIVIPKNNPPIFTIQAPLMFTCKQYFSDKATEAKLKTAFGLEKSPSGYYFIPKATFLVGNMAIIDNSQRKMRIEDKINAVATAISKRTAVAPVHDVKLETKKYYIVWLIPQNMGKPVDAILSITDKTKIFVEV